MHIYTVKMLYSLIIILLKFKVLSKSSAEMWWSSRLVSQGGMNDSPDGVHSSNASLRLRAQILLNLYCNDHMNFNDGTCCSSTEPYNSLQSYMLLFFIIW